MLASFGLHYLGHQHPDPFIISPLLIVSLLLGPALALGFWLILLFFQKFQSITE
tara:strand:- start:608 stop:769 length:162 start_codon:yes stop_codon:yes gene_type:complete